MVKTSTLRDRLPTAQERKDRREQTRLLACSLFYAALGQQPPPVEHSEQTNPVRKGSAGQPAPQTGRRWNKETILQAIQLFRITYGHLPTWKEWREGRQLGLPSRDTVNRYWFSMVDLYAAAERLSEGRSPIK